MAVKMPQRNGKNRISQILRFGLFWAIIIFVALIFYATLFPASNLKDVALSDVVRINQNLPSIRSRNLVAFMSRA